MPSKKNVHTYFIRLLILILFAHIHLLWAIPINFLQWHPAVYYFDYPNGKDFTFELPELADLNPDRIELMAIGKSMDRTFNGGLITPDNRFYFFELSYEP